MTDKRKYTQVWVQADWVRGIKNKERKKAENSLKLLGEGLRGASQLGEHSPEDRRHGKEKVT